MVNSMEDGVRFAETEEELRASYQLRYKVYVECMGRLKDKSNHELKELRDEYDKNARAVVAIKDGQPIGTLRLFWGGDAPFTDSLKEAYSLNSFLDILQEKDICIVERLMVDEKHRGSSTTLRMYKEVMHFVLDKKAEAVFLDCEPHHLNSYLKLGFRPFTHTYSYPGIGLVIPMVLIAGDYEHFKLVGSPFGMLTREDDLVHCRHTEQLLHITEQRTNILSQASSNQAEFLKNIYDQTDLLISDKPKIFDELTEDELRRVIERSHIIDCMPGDHIIEKNNAAKTLFVLLSGVVEVRRNGQLLAIITPGEVIGEIAYFLNIPRSANVTAATENVRLLSLDEPSMTRLLKYESALANKVLMNMCRSLCSRVISGVEISDLR